MHSPKKFFILIFLAMGSIVLGTDESRWVPLFDGKSLSGWKTYGAERWAVDQGEILSQALTEAYGYLGTEKTYRNFEMKVKFRAEGTGNSGIFFHSSIEGVDIKGIQVEVDPNPDMHTGGLYESGGRGWLVKPDAKGEKAMKVGKWNDVHFIVSGSHIVTLVNGEKIVDYTDPSPQYTNGVIALQLHSGGQGKIRFKDLYIREITER